jgi:putative membrane protein
MNIRVLTVLAATALVAFAFGCDRKDNQMSGRGDNRGLRDDQAQSQGRGDSQSHQDQAFFDTAARANLAEAETGALAAKLANDEGIKKFAQQMVDDHSGANRELTDLATKKGIRLPTRPDEAHQKEAARLAQMSGHEFDQKYAKMMVKDHTEAVALFEKNSMQAKDSDVKAFAAKMLPVLRDHLKMAKDLSGKVGEPTAD